MKKLIAIAIAATLILAFTTIAGGETDQVQGTFTPTGGTVAISCNKTTPAFGNINLGASAVNHSFNVSNDGTTNVSVVTTAASAGDWALVAGTSSTAASDEYCVNMDPGGGYVDIYTQQTIIADMIPAGTGTNYTFFNLTVFVSDFTTQGTPSQQTFYTNLTAAAVS